MTRLEAPWLDWAESRAVCGALEDAGYQALFVGGCVRNALLGVPVSDLDIATDARPEKTLALAKAAGLKAIPTGIDHGTITVVADGKPFEVTTFRRDVETDGRHAVVRYSDSVAEDARRRDFTMNALYARSEGKVVDPLGGLPDLDAGRLRFVGNAEQRIAEDYLRILRFFRFTAWYGNPDLGIDAIGLAACAAGVDGLAQISAERIGHEIRRMLAAPDPGPAVASMESSGVLAAVLPGAVTTPLAPLIALENAADTSPDPLRRLAALGGEDLSSSLRLSKAEGKRLTELRELVGSREGPAEISFRHGQEMARDVVLLRAATFGNTLSDSTLAEIEWAAAQDFPIKASDLMPQFSGVALGRELERLKSLWIGSGFEMTREALLSEVDRGAE